jgi:hypothetical protein
VTLTTKFLGPFFTVAVSPQRNQIGRRLLLIRNKPEGTPRDQKTARDDLQQEEKSCFFSFPAKIFVMQGPYSEKVSDIDLRRQKFSVEFSPDFGPGPSKKTQFPKQQIPI